MKHRLPLVDLKGNRLAISEQKLTCEILTGGLCFKDRERMLLVDFQVRQRLPLVDLKGKRLAIGEQINLRNTDR